MNENYNSKTNFFAESKFEVRISIIWTHACVLTCGEGGGVINYLCHVENKKLFHIVQQYTNENLK
jgi:hypothetical protein